MANDSVVLRFSDVTFEYGHNKHILDEASFSVRTGSRITLMGQNGAGKSSLFKMITGANPIVGNNLVEILTNQVHSAPMSFEQASPYVQVPAEVQSVIYKALAKDPEHRQSSMTQFRSYKERYPNLCLWRLYLHCTSSDLAYSEP